jgi:cytochrome oxidase assembly protein ShyY1
MAYIRSPERKLTIQFTIDTASENAMIAKQYHYAKVIIKGTLIHLKLLFIENLNDGKKNTA